jgi:long-chain acyl-CoA synthetase
MATDLSRMRDGRSLRLKPITDEKQHMTGKISMDEARNLPGLFRLRTQRTPDKVAYRYFNTARQTWLDIRWDEMAAHVARWQAALQKENLPAGSRVGLMLCNCPQWIMYEQAVLGLGLVLVPLYPNDRAENIAYIIHDADIKVLLFDGHLHWSIIKPVCPQLTPLQRIVSLTSVDDSTDARFIQLTDWLPEEQGNYALSTAAVHESTLATIVYTSGTTGRPKGVMLSHGNILWNADSGADSVPLRMDDIFLSFLPLSHMLERTVGYYIPMLTGATVAYARSIELLAEDLVIIRPTVLITVPRIFERVYNKIKSQLAHKPPLAGKLFAMAVDIGWQRFLHQQGRAAWQPSLLLWPVLNVLVANKIMQKLGGRMRLAVSGGAPLSMEIGRTFIGLGLTISQGYGLTETSPTVCTNRLDDNDPFTVGQALRDVEVKLGDNDELLIRSPGVMLGYWHNETATREVIDADGWFHSGDKAKIERGHISITGRLKEILVLSNGEKLPPADVEMAILNDPLFDQALLIGEQKPYLSAIVVLNKQHLDTLANALGIAVTHDNLNNPTITAAVLERIRQQMTGFPGYAKIYRVFNTLEPWSVDTGLITPTLKLRRKQILERFATQITQMYAGH